MKLWRAPLLAAYVGHEGIGVKAKPDVVLFSIQPSCFVSLSQAIKTYYTIAAGADMSLKNVRKALVKATTLM